MELYPPLSHPKGIAGVRLKLNNILLMILVPGVLLAQTAATPVAPDANATQETRLLPLRPQRRRVRAIPGRQRRPRISAFLVFYPIIGLPDGSIPFEPITTKQKFTIARKDSLDYPSYVLAGVFALIAQANNTNPSFGQGVRGVREKDTEPRQRIRLLVIS